MCENSGQENLNIVAGSFLGGGRKNITPKIAIFVYECEMKPCCTKGQFQSRAKQGTG